MRIILASKSPRRRELLQRLGVDFEVADSCTSEISNLSSPKDVVRELAERKARAVGSSMQVKAGLIIGADTIIDLDGEILGKPESAPDARTILSRLRGRTHKVITGLAILDGRSEEVRVSSVATSVYMHRYSDQAIVEYIGSGEPMDKAGAYGIQGKGGKLVRCIEGCYLNVVGFPLCEVSRALKGFGVHSPAPEPVCCLPSGTPCPRLTLASSGT